MDLILNTIMGYLTYNNTGRVLGSVFVNKLIERCVLTLVKISLVNTLVRFSNASEEAQSLYLEFGHDSTIMAIMAAMDLNRYISILLVSDFVSYIHLKG